MRWFVFLLVSIFLLPEDVNACQLNAFGEIYGDLKLDVDRAGPVNCSWSRIWKIFGRLEIVAHSSSLLSLPLLEEIVSKETPLLVVRSSSLGLAVHLPRLASLQLVGNSSSGTQPLVKFEGTVGVGVQLLLNLKRISGGRMEVGGETLDGWLERNAPSRFRHEVLLYFLAAVAVLILFSALLRGIHSWQARRLDDEVEKDLARMREYLLERRKAKFARLQLHVQRGERQHKVEEVHRLLGVTNPDRARVLVAEKQPQAMEQWLERNEKENKQQERFVTYFGTKLQERREGGQRRQEEKENILRVRRTARRSRENGRAEGLEKAFKRAQETSAGRKKRRDEGGDRRDVTQ